MCFVKKIGIKKRCIELMLVTSIYVLTGCNEVRQGTAAPGMDVTEAETTIEEESQETEVLTTEAPTMETEAAVEETVLETDESSTETTSFEILPAGVFYFLKDFGLYYSQEGIDMSERRKASKEIPGTLTFNEELDGHDDFVMRAGVRECMKTYVFDIYNWCDISSEADTRYYLQGPYGTEEETGSE